MESTRRHGTEEEVPKELSKGEASLSGLPQESPGSEANLSGLPQELSGSEAKLSDLSQELPTGEGGQPGEPLKTGKRVEEDILEKEMPAGCSGCPKTKKRSQKEYRDLMNRLNRIEGQVRGIRGMLEKDAYCTDILVQVSAVNAALNSFSRVLLSNHIHTCVAENIRAGNDEVIDELTGILQKLMR